ncbi:MAG: hypothetical protein SNF33_02830 [Candidatus Algichlamydia australiensis]|nr:hypothetical protein [Chlamydiales bacterium]
MTTLSSGCRETSRSFIPPEKIYRILVSQRFEQSLHPLQEKVVFVPSIKEKVEFSYKDEHGNPQTFSIPNLSIPNYQSILEELFQNRVCQDQPIYTHMTRLPLPESE